MTCATFPCALSWSALGGPCRGRVGLFLENLVPHVPCVDGQKVGVELEHVLSRLIMFDCGFLCGLQGLLKLSLDGGVQGG